MTGGLPGVSTPPPGPWGLLGSVPMASPADRVVLRLGELLGPTAARSTLNTFCKRTVGVNPESITDAQMPLVLPALRPLLSVMVGTVKADAVIKTLLEEFRT